MRIAGAQLEDARQAGGIDLAVCKKPARGIKQFAVARLGDCVRHLRKMRFEDRDRLVAVLDLAGIEVFKVNGR